MPEVKPTDLVFQRDAIRHIIRYWMHNLTGAQLKVVMMIYDRTIMWQQLDEIISFEQFSKGKISSNGEIAYAGTGLSRTSVHNALCDLVESGCVMRTSRGVKRAPYYRINFEWEPVKLNTFTNMRKKMPTPKRLRSCSESEHVLCKDILPLKKKNKEKRTKREEHKRGQAHADSNELSSLRSKNKQSRVDREVKRQETTKIISLRQKDLRSFWRDTVNQFFEDEQVTALSTKEQHALFQKQKHFVEATGGVESFPAFAEWAIENWEKIMSTKFSWMSDTPDAPHGWFFIRNYADFYQLFKQGEREWQKILNPEAREATATEKEIEKLRAEKKALAAERQKLENERGKKILSPKRKRPDSMASKEFGKFNWNDDEEK